MLIDGKADKTQTIKELDKMDKNINDIKRIVLNLEEKVKLMDREVKQCNQYIEMLQKQIKNLPAPQMATPSDNGINDQLIKQMLARIENLENELD